MTKNIMFTGPSDSFMINQAVSTITKLFPYNIDIADETALIECPQDVYKIIVKLTSSIWSIDKRRLQVIEAMKSLLKIEGMMFEGDLLLDIRNTTKKCEQEIFTLETQKIHILQAIEELNRIQQAMFEGELI